MKYKLIAFDVDGTLWDYHDNCIQPSTLQAINELKEKGVYIALATARTYAELNRPCQQDVRADYVIGASGHSILDAENRSIYTERFTLEQTQRVLDLAREYDAGLILKFNNVKCIYNHMNTMRKVFGNIGISACPTVECEMMDYHLKKLPIGFTIHTEHEIREKMIKELSLYPTDYRVEPYHNGTTADIFLPSVNKLFALQHLCVRLGIDAENIMTFGDSANDIAMTKWAGFGVAMGNGNDELKEVADYVCETGWEDGIAKTIRKFAMNSN